MRRMRKYWKGIILIASLLLAIMIEAKAPIPIDNSMMDYYIDLGQKIIQNDYFEDEVHCSISRPINGTKRLVIYVERPFTGIRYFDFEKDTTIIIVTSALTRIITVIVITLAILDVASGIIGFIEFTIRRRQRRVEQT